MVGEIRGEWKKCGVGGRNIFQMFCVLSQNFYVPLRNFYVLLQRYLCSLAKPVEFRQTLPVYFTASSGYSSYVHNGAVQSFILNLDSTK